MRLDSRLRSCTRKGSIRRAFAGFGANGSSFLGRFTSGVDSVEEALPNGFKERTGERGLVYGGWVPQSLILNHPCVGCFVTHRGYGSSWEGLMSQCQLVLLPQHGDQYVNAKLLSGDLGVGVEVEEGDEDGRLKKEAVSGTIMRRWGVKVR
ncbi:Anthocyanidin 3-O-glucoside 2'''-O-xylosyltransferase [Sesamum alatum]|uniref:Anthocyanidin 3-O-glucoside 2'''-O-xylosyltransferase n=1 Tax=Sesamum alatum TaxID=300844 RepID=A0AAE2CZP7_9LAMI|nr:Anthocyanidin 3-O-glucoside 2'''-O-xylosyltransferase [Sesamum alatum]